jgi:hypothetical protein
LGLILIAKPVSLSLDYSQIALSGTELAVINNYAIYGLSVCSEIPLPELVVSESSPDIVIRLGRVEPISETPSAAERNIWATFQKPIKGNSPG